MVFENDKITQKIIEDKKIWIEIDPIQCLENPWEKDWIENNLDEDYPRDNALHFSEIEENILKEFYKKKGITIFDIKPETYSGDFEICESCSCSQELLTRLYNLFTN